MATAERSALVRRGTIALGAGLIAFTAPLMVAPRRLTPLGGISVPDESTASMVRSVAARDLIYGIGLISAARHGSRLAPWLLMRALMDAGDALWVALAFLRGGGNVRLAALGAVALGAGVFDLALYRLARSDDA